MTNPHPFSSYTDDEIVRSLACSFALSPLEKLLLDRLAAARDREDRLSQKAADLRAEAQYFIDAAGALDAYS